MTQRINRNDNRKIELRSNYNQTTLRCPQGYTWVATHIRSGKLVNGHCKKIRIINYQREQVIREKSKKYGWDRGPVYIKEDRVIETYRKFNNSLEREQ